LKPIIEDECARRGIWINIIELKPDSKVKKENRIRGSIEPYLEKSLLWCRDDQADFLQEFRDFPTGHTVDLLDAFAYGPQMWKKPFEELEDPEEANNFMWNPDRSVVTGY